MVVGTRVSIECVLNIITAAAEYDRAYLSCTFSNIVHGHENE